MLCEKPLTRRPEEAKEAFDAAEREDLVLMEAFMYRHHPQTHKVADLVSSGAIGRLRLVRSSFSFPLADVANVRLLAELDGGSLMDAGCYCVNGSRLLAGEPERVYGEQVVGETGVDLAFHGTIRFAADVVAQFDCSFAAPVRQRLEAVGEGGILTVEAPWRIDWGGDVLLRRGGDLERLEADKADSYRLELENMGDAIRGRAQPLLGRDDAVAQARALQALYRSADAGTPVSV